MRRLASVPSVPTFSTPTSIPNPAVLSSLGLIDLTPLDLCTQDQTTPQVIAPRLRKKKVTRKCELNRGSLNRTRIHHSPLSRGLGSPCGSSTDASIVAHTLDMYYNPSPFDP